MKIKYWLSLLILFSVLFSAGCSQATTQTGSTSTTTISTTPNVPTITVLEAYNLIQRNIGNPDFVVLDVRTAGEFSTDHIAGAVNIDYESAQFTVDVSELDKNKEYLVYCATGIRGAVATQIMISLGFKQVQNMAGGITAWIQAGYPVIKPTTISTTGSVTTAPTTTSAPLSNGLELRVTVNSTSLTPGESLQISISEYNTLSTNNDVSAEKSWGVNGLSLGACPNIYVQPFGVAVLQGRFTAQNITQATPLNIFGVAACPMFIRLITEYIFQPNSINAAVMPGGDLTAATPMSANITINGFYAQENQFNPLATGIYTIVAGDEWGTIELLYINVD